MIWPGLSGSAVFATRQLPQNGPSAETISQASRNGPETKRRHIVPCVSQECAVMSFVVALLICCSAVMFAAHAVDAYRAA
jgi:hypothetical protein